MKAPKDEIRMARFVAGARRQPVNAATGRKKIARALDEDGTRMDGEMIARWLIR